MLFGHPTRALPRAMTAASAGDEYPQTPMQVKFGAWSAGDPANEPGTIQWANGPTDYAAGPFAMRVRDATVVDYSTGKSYSYGDQTGSWRSTRASGSRCRLRGPSAPLPSVAWETR